jgi:radical SAM-linked protein
MARRVPEGPPPAPVVQRLRIRYAKRGRLRFTSHRDFARAFERAVRRADLPIGYSAGFSPHPRISYVGASPTGVASEAEYLEIGLTRPAAPAAIARALDEALPPGLDILEVVPAGPGSLAERIEASHWRIELPGVEAVVAASAVAELWARPAVEIERLTKSGLRSVDVRAALVSIRCDGTVGGEDHGGHAIMTVVVRQVTPAVRPDDVLTALRLVAGLAPAVPPVAVRLAQGPLDDAGAVGDPLATDRDHADRDHASTPS